MKEIKYCYFRDVFPIQMGKTPPRGDDASWDKKKTTRNYWVSVADITKNEGKYITDTKEYISDSAAKKIFKVKTNSLLMSFKLTIGKMAFAGVDLCTNEAIIAIPENEKYNLRFLYYYLSLYDWKTLTEGSEKVKGATLNKTSIGQIKLPIMPLPEQERIVSFLDAEFARIDALKANTEQQLQAAKDLFQLQFRQSIDKIGECEFYTLGNICTTINGLWKGKRPPFVKVGVIRNANFTKDFTLNFSNIEYLDVEERQYLTRKLENGDLIVEKSGGSEKQPVGRTVLFDNDGEFSVSNFTSILRIKDRSLFLPKYLYLYMLYIYKNGVTREMQNATTGIHNIIFDKFLAIEIPALSIIQQEDIINQSEKMIDKINSLQANYNQTITLCNDLKQSLLKSVFE